VDTYYTYFDRNYAVRAVAMFRSLWRNSGPLQMFMLCLDLEAYDAVARLHLPDVTLLQLAELEQEDPDLLKVKASRSIVEYYFTITSCLGWHLMKTQPQIQVLTYLDSDLFFYRPVGPLLQEFEGQSIGAMYHCLPEHGLLRQGRYNVGWVSWRRDAAGMACLEEYRRQCLDWCYLREEKGKYADQVYLDAWEKKPGFHAFQHRGANVAAWNLGHYQLGYDHGGIQVNGDPLIFFHFHKFSALGGNCFDTNLWLARRLTKRLRDRLILPYIDELRKTGLDLPLTGSHLRHFPYRHGLGRWAKNMARIGLSLIRCTYVHYPPKVNDDLDITLAVR
jgi:hypothetical protein